MNDGGDTQPVPTGFSKKKQPKAGIEDDIFNTITNDNESMVNNKKSQQTNDDPFNILNMDISGNQTTTTPLSNDMGMGDLLGFSTPSPTPVQNNQGVNSLNNPLGGDILGGDFLGLGTNNNNMNTQPQTLNTQAQSVANQGLGNWGVNSAEKTPKQETNNTFLAYENSQIQIWMICNKESADTAKIVANYINKTQSNIDSLTIQAAVMKHLKLTINPLNNTSMQPLSKGVVSQVNYLFNSDHDCHQ